MARGFIRTVAMGNLGRDIDLRYSQNGNPIARASLAVGRWKSDGNGQGQEVTDWYQVTFFGKNAENAAEWLQKGSRVLVDGRMQIEQYTGQDGQERTSVSILVDTFHNLSPRDAAPAAVGSAPPRVTTPPRPVDDYDPFTDLDDVPF